MAKQHLPNPICKVCGDEYARRVHRNAFAKIFLPWLGNRRYFCATCEKKYYVTVEQVRKNR